jgi:hypothetical protein
MPRLLTILIIVAAGCGGSSNQTERATPDTSKSPAPAGGQAPQTSPADQTVQGMQQVAQGLRQLTQSQAAPVDFEMLKTLLPEVPGWSKGRSRGEQVNMPFAISNATAHYTNGESTMDVTITDSALNQLIFAPFSVFMTSGYEERSDDGYKKATTIAGAPGFEEWKKESGRGEVTIVANNRYLVQATGHGIASIDPLRKAIEAVDLKKLK